MVDGLGRVLTDWHVPALNLYKRGRGAVRAPLLSLIPIKPSHDSHLFFFDFFDYPRFSGYS